MNTKLFACVVLGSALCAGAVAAEPYVDYAPHKGVWHVTTVKVDPSHIDDYLTGLKKVWLPGEQVAQKHGLIDSFQIMVKINPADGRGNVLLVEHIPDMALLEADQARDQAVEKEVYSLVSKGQSDEAVSGFDKYRTFVGDDYWSEMSFTK